MEEVKQEQTQQQNKEVRKINLLAFKDPKSPVAEAYRTIRTNLQFSGVDKEMKVVEVTSAVPNEGKSTVMASLAVVLAQARKKVLLMDCDFRNPTQHKLFGLHNRGLTNFMANGDDYTPFIQRVEQEKLDILVSGPVAPNPSEMLMSNKMQDLLDRARTEYDYVLIDTPPIMPVTDAAVLGAKVDGVMMVVASGQDKPELVQAAKNRLVQGGANILGCILNKVQVDAGRYGSGSNKYGYGYGYGY
ncbi:MAG: CpsD/CapB family tyrosine-protein kinase, partial [Acidaminococcaceae bacterium]|nr:CpsD/CapB family tyrosine-protein kinase [Acidaminococcaceae bacterium]